VKLIKTFLIFILRIKENEEFSMKKIFAAILIIYAIFLITINLDSPWLKNIFIPENNNQTKLAINYLSKKYNAVKSTEFKSFTESNFEKILQKNIIFDSSVIDTFKYDSEDYVVLSIALKNKEVTAILKFYPQRYWRENKFPIGKVIVCVKATKLIKTQSLKFLKYIEGINFPFESHDEFYLIGNLIDFVNVS